MRARTLPARYRRSAGKDSQNTAGSWKATSMRGARCAGIRLGIGHRGVVVRLRVPGRSGRDPRVSETVLRSPFLRTVTSTVSPGEA